MKTIEQKEATRRAYYLKNRERILRLNKEWREENKEMVRARKALRFTDPKKREHYRRKQREHYHANREKCLATTKKWCDKNKERRRAQLKAWAARPEVAKRNKENRKKRYNENREMLRQQHRDWCKANREHRAEYHRKLRQMPGYYSRFWQNRKKNPQQRIAAQLRCRVNAAVKKGGAVKSEKTELLIGCSFSELLSHLEKLFKPGMTWENYGVKGWEIDHRRPCDSFDLTDPEQQRACFHYTNLQPLWMAENRSKWNRYEPNVEIAI